MFGQLFDEINDHCVIYMHRTAAHFGAVNEVWGRCACPMRREGPGKRHKTGSPTRTSLIGETYPSIEISEGFFCLLKLYRFISFLLKSVKVLLITLREIEDQE